jgi:hypothetical protein
MPSNIAPQHVYPDVVWRAAVFGDPRSDVAQASAPKLTQKTVERALFTKPTYIPTPLIQCASAGLPFVMRSLFCFCVTLITSILVG